MVKEDDGSANEVVAGLDSAPVAEDVASPADETTAPEDKSEGEADTSAPVVGVLGDGEAVASDGPAKGTGVTRVDVCSDPGLGLASVGGEDCAAGAEVGEVPFEMAPT